MSKLANKLIEMEELIEEQALEIKRLTRMKNGLKLNNGRLTLERRELLQENQSLHQELANIKSMGMYEFADKYCNDEQIEKDAKAFAKSLGVGVK